MVIFHGFLYVYQRVTVLTGDFLENSQPGDDMTNRARHGFSMALIGIDGMGHTVLNSMGIFHGYVK